MGINNSQPMRFTPRGLTDANDATDAFPGASQSMANLIFDDSNPECVVPRPGVVTLANLALAGMSNPTFISVQVSIGTRVYGMVTTSRFPGNDEPFCYDTSTNLLVPISGVNSGNTPTSPATTGDWEPPTMDTVGVYVLVTHPGFSGALFGAINTTTFTSLAWTSQTTATNALTGHPSAVANLNNRAYFAVGNTVQYSDVLDPLTRTNASQSLTVGAADSITALAGLPVTTTSTGILGSLTIFKSSQVWQVTGDSATSDLALNFISLSFGTIAPRSVAQSPMGLYFLSSSGVYSVDPLGGVRAVTSRSDANEPDVQVAFINATTPSRWAATYGTSVYRICGPTIIEGLAQTNDYWFHEKKRRWSGPHSFVYDCASAMGGNFILTSALNSGILVNSQATPKNTSVYTDLGSTYYVTLLSSTLPKQSDMAMHQVAESQIELGGQPTGVTYQVQAQDMQGNVLDSVDIVVPALSLPLWGDGTLWGTVAQGGSGALWSSGLPLPPRTYPVPWTAPLVFDKMQLQVSAAASSAIKIGTFYARYQKTGYMVTNL